MGDEGGEMPCMAHLVDDDGRIADAPIGEEATAADPTEQQPAAGRTAVDGAVADEVSPA